MRKLQHRIEHLERRMMPPDSQLLIVSIVESVNADRYVKTLREYGFAPKGGLALVSVPVAPDGLDEAELDAFIREHARKKACALESMNGGRK